MVINAVLEFKEMQHRMSKNMLIIDKEVNDQYFIHGIEATNAFFRNIAFFLPKCATKQFFF